MKLRTKFLLSMALVTAALTAASLFIVRHSVDSHAREEILQSFQNSTATLHDYQARKDDIAGRTADLLAQTPLLKAVMVTRDPLTIQDTTATLWQTTGSDLFAVEDSSGHLMALHDTGAEPVRGDIEANMHHARIGEFEWWLVGSRLYRVAIRSVTTGSAEDGNTLGFVAVGYEVNSAIAKETARFAAGTVAYRFRDQIITSTLTDVHLRALNSAPHFWTQHGVHELSLSGERFLANVIDISSSPDGPQLIVLQSYDQATAFVQHLNRLILLVGAIVIMLGAVVVFLLSHTFTQPLDDLLTGVRALSQGNFSFPLRIKGKDEIAELTSSFDRMRSNLQQSQDRLVNSARMEAIGQLAGGVAHDFNNLITVIKGYAELLMATISPDDPLSRYADQISKAGDRASALTRQLLAFSRKQKAERQAVDMNGIVTNLTKMLKALVGERYELANITSPKMVKVLADPSQVEQIILNLVVNARDAMADGGRIEIKTEVVTLDRVEAAKHNVTAGRYAHLKISDQGCGMDAETIGKIFQPFFTTKEAGKGTGLGLAIVFAAVKQNDGFIDVASEPGKGASFGIYIPELVAEIRAPEIHKSKFAAQCGSETILVVEDEEGVRNMVRDTLQLRGYKVLLAQNGEEAMQLMHDYRDPIDLVLSDVVMPKLGGLDLAVRLGASTRQAKVLLMSGYTDRINEIEDAGLPLLRKPFSPEKLADSIRSMVSEAAVLTAS